MVNLFTVRGGRSRTRGRERNKKQWICGASILLLVFVVTSTWLLPISFLSSPPEKNLNRVQAKKIVQKPAVQKIPQHVRVNVEWSSSREELRRLSPPETVAEQASLQLDDELMIFAGGYVEGYNQVYRSIQFFNITSQNWLPERRLDLPPGVGETHQGVAFHPESRLLYIVSGQVGGGCSPATTRMTRANVDTGIFEMLPPLPAPRYHPGVAILTDPVRADVKHVHVFGGAAESRNRTATNHWRLILADEKNAKKAVWEELESVPDGGTHGRSFVHDGAIYYTAFCDLDQGVISTNDMMECQKTAFLEGGQLLHHVSDAGFLFKYVTEFATGYPEARRNHWERLPDMPFPACHTGQTVAMGRLFLLGGGITTSQTVHGSVPRSLNMLQTFNFHTESWEASSFSMPENARGYNMAAWVDSSRRKLYGMRPAESLCAGVIESLDKEPLQQVAEFKTCRQQYLDTNRRLSVGKVSVCINEQLSTLSGSQSMKMHSVFDKNDEYETVRTTWNKRLSHLQYPDIVAFPESAEHVSAIVQCAKKTGYRVCGRNGKHSFEGDTCTYGIVVDVAKMTSVDVFDREKGRVRFGSGQTLGRIAVEMENFGLMLPMGHCASVGMTGLVLVGGQGVLSRHLGMTSDYVTALQLVDYNGQIIYATTTNDYSDYVWLARGGGSAVQHFPGIITAIEFEGLPKLEANNSTEKVYTAFKIHYNSNVTVDKAVALLLAWQDFYLDPANVQDPIFDRLTVEPWLWQPKEMYIACYFYGNDELHHQLMDRFLPKLLNLLDGGTLSPIGRYDYLAFHRMLGGVQDNFQLASGQHGWDLKETEALHMLNRWKGYSAVASRHVSGEAFRVLAESIFFQEKYAARRYVEIKPLGGAIQKMGKTETAFWHRDAIWWSLSSHWHRSTDSTEQVDAILKSSREGHSKFIEGMGSSFAGHYAGYIVHGNSTGRDLELYYGKNAARIAEIKKHRDPHNVFRLYLPNTMTNAPFNPS